MCSKRIPDGSFIWPPVYNEHHYACRMCRSTLDIPEQERCPTDPSWKASFDNGEFKPCFLPCVIEGDVWYDICTNFDDESEVCHECYDNFGFVDVIEEN